MKKFLLAALMAGVATSAFAADLPSRKSPPMAPVYMAPAFTWTGVYVGVNGGYGWANSGLGSPGGFVGGGQIGYNYQIGQIVAGVEGDLDFTDMSKTRSATFGSTKFSTGAMVTDRVRLGYAMDRTLFYVTGGYAGIEAKGTYNDTLSAFPAYRTSSNWRNGGVIGGGVEYAFTNNITAKVEYLYAPFASKTYFPGTPDATKSNLDVSTIRLGINYKF